MNDHPPAPPNSKFFKEIDGKLYFLTLTDADEEEWIEVARQAHWYWRNIIGAVAEVEWREEWQRITDEHCGTGGIYDRGWGMKAVDAVDNPNDWRTWAREGNHE